MLPALVHRATFSKSYLNSRCGPCEDAVAQPFFSTVPYDMTVTLNSHQGLYSGHSSPVVLKEDDLGGYFRYFGGGAAA